MDVWYPIQVKQKDKVGRPDIDAFEAVMTREDRNKGIFMVVQGIFRFFAESSICVRS
ncbi:MAG TPA: restriction endonuclease [Sedimentisphaerales bacterium]|nr:restriction endonuclease [Sedimentisphaerales bacterium]